MKMIIMKNIRLFKNYLLPMISVLIITSCASVEIDASRYDVRWVEKQCLTYDCYMKDIGRYKHESTFNEDGTQTFRWYMSVMKTRGLRYGELVVDQRHYAYYYEDCWFTATFDSDGNVLETEWVGPGCWGKGH